MSSDDLQPWEFELVGALVRDGRNVRADATYNRIERLISRVLLRVADGPDGWSVLYQDPQDGRYWELDYPQGELQGGGPPRLRLLNAGELQERYSI